MATNISEFKRLVAPDVLPCPDPIIDREIITAILDFCESTNLLQREFEIEMDEDDIDTEMQDSVDFNIDEFAENLRPVCLLSVMVDSQSYIPFMRNLQTTITNYGLVADEQYKYFWIPSNSIIRLFDMSSTDLVVWFKVSFKPLRTATSVDDFLFEDWSEAIVAGAKWKLMSMPGKDWSNLQVGEFYRREWRKYLSQARRLVVKGGSGQPEHVNWKSFGEID